MGKILFLGNFLDNSGPSVVNRNIYKNLSGNENIIFFNTTKNFLEILNLIKKIKNIDIITISGLGRLNFLVIILAKLFRKKIVYLMHGAVQIESDYKSPPFFHSIFEKIYLYLSNKIICVSNKYLELMFEHDLYNKYKSKFVIINNGVDYKEVLSVPTLKNRNDNMYIITSIGGGRKQKNNLSVCKALDKIKDKKFKYIIIGKKGDDFNEICKYSFVDFKGVLSWEEAIKILKNSDLYIQNSYYESFGISMIEALYSDCDLILSENIGAISLFDHIPEKTIVSPLKIDSLVEAINYRFNNHNNDILKKSLSEEKIDWKTVSLKYLDLWESISSGEKI